ncbi:bifunctional lysylphosphatidylglycerol flippase/synthetase MprF [Streptomyces sp. NPDC058305]|uniref:bifunctional lysylphosphatidylglycerol flippase/synthetase MprF n=1 Tax=Streptomyces sp. NPDC058305 TaxID=3346438 RepID=UPI0036EDFD93
MSTTEESVAFDSVAQPLRKYAENPSAFLALNSGTEYFLAPGTEGFVAYRTAGRYLVQFGGVFGPEGEQEKLLKAFLEFARAKRRKVCAIQLQRSDADLYARCGFTVNQVGSSFSLHLPAFTLKGSRFMKLRNKISRAKRSGLQIDEVAYDEVAGEIDALDQRWLRSKGRHVKEIEFLVGQCGGPAQSERRLFVGRVEGAVVAYISYSPAYGSRAGWLHDLSRRDNDASPGVMEAVNAHAIDIFRTEGAEWLHFGFTPFTRLDPGVEVSAASPVTGKFMRFLADHGEKVYPSASQLAYKEKWAPQLVLPEYLAFHGRARFGAIWQILRVTKSI